MDPQHLTRLQEEQAKALTDTDKQILQIEKYKSDYQVLQERLRTLPDELTYDIMVPFGKLAFMPGKLVHTNEILVLLGDNWFVERSAKQAEDIAQRRIEELNKQLTNLGAQKKLLEPRLEFTSDFQGNKDVKEIVEEYDAEKERLWDEQHRKNVHKEKEAARKLDLKFLSKPRAIKTQPHSDSDLWARLDALEEEEKKRGELESGDSEEEKDDDGEKPHLKGTKSHSVATDIDGQESDDYSDDERAEDANDGDEEISDDDDEEELKTDDSETSNSKDPAVRTIRFTHTATPSYQTKTADSARDTIVSPADIYKLYCPASILKKPGTGRKKRNKSASAASKAVGFSSEGNNELPEKPPSGANPIRPFASSSIKAFSGMILETSQNMEATSPKPELLEQQQDKVTSDETPKRVSKFKASRMAQQGFS